MRPHCPNADPVQRSPASLSSDDRGAIMVLGIFMCAVMVGALWYVAGLGDAIVYRERLQEAADAGALSNAVLHARGMNLLVLINLIMACVLAIRVALKVLQLTLVFAGVVFMGMSFFPPLAWMASIAAACAELAEGVQNVIDTTREPINNTLKALHTAQKGISPAIPGASVLGSRQVINEYKPFLTEGAASPDVTKLGGLPVVDGTVKRLCGEAGEAMVDIIDSVIPDVVQPAMGPFKEIMGGIVAGGSEYFCELGGTGKPPDLTDMINKSAGSRCDDEYKKLEREFDEANKAWHAECDADKVICLEVSDPNNPGQTKATMSGLEALQKSTKPEDKAALDRLNKLKEERDAKEDAKKSFDKPKCVENQKKVLKQGLDKVKTQTSNSQGMEPMKVDPKWFNGTNDAQILAIVKAGEEFLRRGPKGVRVGAMKDRNVPKEIKAPLGAEFAYAQAEFFYDCPGEWKGEKCNAGPSRYNDGEEAMWHLAWRARLRRYNKPFNIVEIPLNGLLATRIYGLGYDLARNATTDPENTLRRVELADKTMDAFKLH